MKTVSIYLIVDGVKYDQFTYQPSSKLIVYDDHIVQNIQPPHGSCGSKLMIHLQPSATRNSAPGDDNDENDETATTINNVKLIHDALATQPVTVLLGSAITMVCMYDTSPQRSGTNINEVNGAIKCLQPTPLLSPGGHHLRVSPDQGQNYGYGGARWISYDTPHSGYTGPNRGGTNADGTSTKTSLFFLRFAPRSGPMEGGTHVIVTGRDLAGGHGYKCRFGGKEVCFYQKMFFYPSFENFS